MTASPSRQTSMVSPSVSSKNNMNGTNSRSQSSPSSPSSSSLILSYSSTAPTLNYDTHETPLYETIGHRDWTKATQLCQDILDNKDNSNFPNEAATWVVRYKDVSSILWRFLPIHSACALSPPVSFLRALLQCHPAAARTMDHQGLLPLHYACGARCRREIIYTLLMSFPQASAVGDPRGMLPLHYLAQWGPAESDNKGEPGGGAGAGVLEMMLVATGDLANAKDKDGNTPHRLAQNASYSNHAEVATQIAHHVMHRGLHLSHSHGNFKPTSTGAAMPRNPSPQVNPSPRHGTAVTTINSNSSPRPGTSLGSPRYYFTPNTSAMASSNDPTERQSFPATIEHEKQFLPTMTTNTAKKRLVVNTQQSSPHHRHDPPAQSSSPSTPTERQQEPPPQHPPPTPTQQHQQPPLQQQQEQQQQHAYQPVYSTFADADFTASSNMQNDDTINNHTYRPINQNNNDNNGIVVHHDYENDKEIEIEHVFETREGGMTIDSSVGSSTNRQRTTAPQGSDTWHSLLSPMSNPNHSKSIGGPMAESGWNKSNFPSGSFNQPSPSSLSSSHQHQQPPQASPHSVDNRSTTSDPLMNYSRHRQRVISSPRKDTDNNGGSNLNRITLNNKTQTTVPATMKNVSSWLDLQVSDHSNKVRPRRSALSWDGQDPSTATTIPKRFSGHIMNPISVSSDASKTSSTWSTEFETNTTLEQPQQQQQHHTRSLTPNLISTTSIDSTLKLKGSFLHASDTSKSFHLSKAFPPLSPRGVSNNSHPASVSTPRSSHLLTPPSDVGLPEMRDDTETTITSNDGRNVSSTTVVNLPPTTPRSSSVGFPTAISSVPYSTTQFYKNFPTELVDRLLAVQERYGIRERSVESREDTEDRVVPSVASLPTEQTIPKDLFEKLKGVIEDNTTRFEQKKEEIEASYKAKLEEEKRVIKEYESLRAERAIDEKTKELERKKEEMESEWKVKLEEEKELIRKDENRRVETVIETKTQELERKKEEIESEWKAKLEEEKRTAKEYQNQLEQEKEKSNKLEIQLEKISYEKKSIDETEAMLKVERERADELEGKVKDLETRMTSAQKSHGEAVYSHLQEVKSLRASLEKATVEVEKSKENAHSVANMLLVAKENEWNEERAKLKGEIEALTETSWNSQNAEHSLKTEMYQKEQSWQLDRKRSELEIKRLKDALKESSGNSDLQSVMSTSLHSSSSVAARSISSYDNSTNRIQLNHAMKEAEEMRKFNAAIRKEHDETITDLEKELEKERENKTELLSKIVTLQYKVATLEQELEDINVGAGSVEVSLYGMRSKLRDSVDESDSFRRAVDARKKDNGEKEHALLEQLNHAHQRIKQLEEKIYESTGTNSKEFVYLQQLTEVRDTIEKQEDHHRRVVAQLESKISLLKEREETLNAARDSSSKKEDHHRRVITELESKISLLKAREETLLEARDSVNKQEEYHRRVITELELKISQLNEREETLVKQLDDVNNYAEILSEHEKSYKNQLADTKKQLASLQDAEESYLKEIRQMKQRIRELEENDDGLDMKLSEAKKMQEWAVQEKEDEYIQKLRDVRKDYEKILQEKDDTHLQEVRKAKKDLQEAFREKEEAYVQQLRDAKKKEQALQEKEDELIKLMEHYSETVPVRESINQTIQDDIVSRLQDARMEDEAEITRLKTVINELRLELESREDVSHIKRQLVEHKRELERQQRKHKSELNKLHNTLELQKTKESRLQSHLKSMETQITEMVSDYESKLEKAYYSNVHS